MALTHEEKKEILELRGKQHSLRKIADKTGHSETTIRGVTKEAERQVFRLRAQGLGAEDIASDLDLPFPFVRAVVDKWDSQQKEARELIEQRAGPGTAVEIGTRWDQFRRIQDLESAKNSLQARIEQQLSTLQGLEQRLDAERIGDKDWHQRKKRLEHQLTDFVLQLVKDVNSQEELKNLEDIAVGIENEVGLLCDEYRAKASKARQLRDRRGKQRSSQLLDQTIGTPLVPTSVRREIKRLVIVRNEKEASIVDNAVFQFAIQVGIPDRLLNSPESVPKLWDVFVGNIKEQGWDYLQKLAQKWEEDIGKLLALIGVCATCDVKLVRQRARGKEILRCPMCNRSWWMPTEPKGRPAG